MREWRKNNPEEARAIGRRKWEAIKADPERLERHRAYHAEHKREWAKANRDRARRNQRNSFIRTHFGLEPEDYDRMLAEQGGVCAICRGGPVGRHKYLCVDHDHATGAVRGLLCDKCNRAIGLLGDSAERLSTALAYLASYA